MISSALALESQPVQECDRWLKACRCVRELCDNDFEEVRCALGPAPSTTEHALSPRAVAALVMLLIRMALSWTVPPSYPSLDSSQTGGRENRWG